MAHTLTCTTCYHVKLPVCFDYLVATLEPFSAYDAVFTNHFGKKKIIEVMTEADGSFQIAADEFVPGYFTSYNTVTVEFYLKSSGGYYYGATDGDGCTPVTVCGTHACFTLEFFDTDDAVEFAGINCCDAETDGCDCRQYTPVETVGEFRALLQEGKYNYLVMGGSLEDEFEEGGLSFLSKEAFEYVIATLGDDELFSSEMNSQSFYHLACDEDMMQPGVLSGLQTTCGDCLPPVVVTTVGDVQQLADPEKQNFLLLIVEANPLIGRVAIAFPVPVDEVYQGDPSLSLSTFFSDLPEGFQFFRFLVCNDLSIVPAATMEVTESVVMCIGDTQLINFDVQYEHISAGSAIQVYALRGGEEVAITTNIPISGSDTIFFDYSDGQFPEGLEIDSGENYLKAVITLANGTTMEDAALVYVEKCDEDSGPPPAPAEITINEVVFTCEDMSGGIVPNTFLGWNWTNIPADTPYTIYALTGEDATETEIASGVIEGTDGAATTFQDEIPALYEGSNYIKIIVALPDGAEALVQTYNFDVSGCTPAVSVTDASFDSYIGEDYVMIANVSWTNLPIDSTITLYMLSDGVETEWPYSPSIIGGNGSFELNFEMPALTGTNYVRAVVTLPDSSTIEDIFDLDITDECI